MTNLWDDLLGCLDLLELPSAGEPGTGDGRAEQAGTDARGAASAGFEGRNQQLSYHRLFGGQLLAQFVRAASLASPGKTVKSLHVLFPREGRSQEPVRYEVERHLQGSTFAALTIRARQAKGVIATASVSMHALENGLSQQAIDPVPAVPGVERRVELGLIPWETRSAADLDARESALPEFRDRVRRSQPVEPRFVRSKKTGYGAGTSITAADPIPPPAHIAATPMPPPRRRSSCTSVTSIRAPVAATG